jgi:hypothetical protein
MDEPRSKLKRPKEIGVALGMLFGIVIDLITTGADIQTQLNWNYVGCASPFIGALAGGLVGWCISKLQRN